MQNSYRFPQQKNYVVDPVYNWQLGFISDGRILYILQVIFAPSDDRNIV